MLWVVLSWIESIVFIQGHSRLHHDEQWHGTQFIDVFARRAQVFYNLTTQGWSSSLCGGGMTWNPRLEPYKNAITNQLFVAASVGMYLHYPGDSRPSTFKQSHFKVHDRRLLDSAVRGYDWLKSSNMTNSQGLFVDGFHISGWHSNGTNATNTACDARNEMVYTYNQGVLLSALRDLWQATANSSYLDDGHELVTSTIAATGWDLDGAHPSNSSAWQGLGRNGILEDLCDSTGACNQDAHSFKSIYFHHLALFCTRDSGSEATPDIPPIDGRITAKHRRRCIRYRAWVRHNARAAMSTRDEYGRIGTWWGADTALTALEHRQVGPLPAHLIVTLPDGALDYTNDRRAMRRMRHGPGAERGQRSYDAKHKPAKSHAASAQRLLVGHRPRHTPDWNDRGRGRTVESHAGGVAVLRCLREFEQL